MLDNIDEIPPPSLVLAAHNDIIIKIINRPQLAINNQKLQMSLQNYLLIQTNTIAEKFAFSVVWSSLALSATLFMAIHSKMDYG